MSAIPAKTRAAVRERDQDRCVRCSLHVNVAGGGSIHHRQRRRDGGHRPCNLIVLCGSGTTGCHGWVTAHPAQARDSGFIVPTWGDPATTPILYQGRLMMLGDDYSLECVN